MENDYPSITLDNVACDDSYLIAEYTIELKDRAIKEYGEIKKFEYELVFYRKTDYPIATVVSDYDEDETTILDDISKDEFTMLFGKKNGTKFVGNGLEVSIPEKITKNIKTENVKVENIDKIQ